MAVLRDDLKALIVRAARNAARDQVLPRFRQLAAHEISTKSGPADLVTLADTMAEDQLKAEIGAGWPEALVVGEESVAGDSSLRDAMATTEWAVVIDPVDGTWNYAKGLALFGMIIAVLHRGLPVYGLLYDPVLDDWIEAGTDLPTRVVMAGHEPKSLAVSGEVRVGRISGYVPLGLFSKAAKTRIVTEFPDFARIYSLRCSCHEYRMVAQGHAEFVLSGPVPHPWDHAAGVLAVQRAGGVSRMLDGREYHAGIAKGVVLTAGTQTVWDDLARRFAFLA
ncbi:MAG: inositol monophosphatase [Rhodobacterales bacterium]|nr:inositol monophosphatase [Rhodobacterales bacterium]